MKIFVAANERERIMLERYDNLPPLERQVIDSLHGLDGGPKMDLRWLAQSMSTTHKKHFTTGMIQLLDQRARTAIGIRKSRDG